MGWYQTVFGASLVAVLLFVAVFYSWRQIRALRRLRFAETMPLRENRYYRVQAWRRLVSCVLLFLLAALLTWALVYLEGPAQELADTRAAERAAGTEQPLTPEQRHFLNLYSGHWIVFLLVLGVVLVLAALDLWSTRRYALQEQRRLQADRRAMIERQAARLRQERNESRE